MKKVTAILLLCASTLFAQVPDEITYQGRLREYGQPVTGTRVMSFKVYHTATGPGLDWESGNKTVKVSSGAFTCALSPDIDWCLQDYWIEAVVSGKTLSPREKLTAQVYALHSRTAEDIEKIAGSTISFTIGGERKAAISSGGEFSTLMNSTTFYMVPRGAIIMWSGAIDSIPSGWKLCDGTNGTPNLSGRFIVGYNSSDSDYNLIANTGGEKVHTLTIQEMPIHSHGGTSDNQSRGHAHSGTTGLEGSHAHTYSTRLGYYNADGDMGGYWGNEASATTSSDGNHSHAFTTGDISQGHTHTFSTGNMGGGQAHENRPPYFVLAFIMKV